MNPDQEFSFLILGRMIHENSYERTKKEIVLDGCKFDLITKRGNKIVIGEIKKSSKALKSATAQLKYYLYILNNKGIDIKTGEILVPKEKKRIKVFLNESDIEHIEKTLVKIEEMLDSNIPKAVKIPFCKNCAYGDFCWS